MGMEYRDRAGRQRRRRRSQKRQEKHWASLAGPVEVRRLDDEREGEAEDEPRSCTPPASGVEDQGDGPDRDEAGGDTA